MSKIERERWLPERNKGIGSSDIAMVLGVSPYGDPIKLYGEKTGLVPHEDMEQDYIEIGNEMEEFVARRFAKKHPEFQVVDAPFIRSAIHPWIQANPDRLLLNDKGVVVGVLEAKNAGGHQRRYWGESGTDEAPVAFHAQACWSAIVLKMSPKRVFEDDYPLPPANGKPIQRFVACLIGGSDYREYPIHPDDELDGILVEQGQKFWANHVLAGIPPKIDGSPSSGDLLKALYPVDSDPVRVATVKETELMGLLRPRLEAYKRLEGEIDELKNQIRESIGTASGIVAPGVGTITNKKTKDGLDTDHKAVVEILRKHVPQIVFDEAMKQHTKVKVGYRRFLPKWEGEKES